MIEHFEYNPNEINRCDQDFILKRFKLISEDKNELLRLSPDSPFYNIEVDSDANEIISSPEQLYPFFESQNYLSSDPILRPENDATLFTTAGIQHIETKLHLEGKLVKESFIIAQPSVRTQYLDKAAEGTTTAFINFCVADIRTTPENFAKFTEQYIEMLVRLGANPGKLSFTIENSEDIWGDKKLDKTTFTILYNGIELGEGVYLHNYPINEKEKIEVADISFGVERLNWALGKSKIYLQEFEELYPKGEVSAEQKNVITAAIDCIRTASLLVSEGLKASHQNPGRSIRQLMKRFAVRNKDLSLSIKELVTKSNDYWQKWGFNSKVNESTVVEILTMENDRSMNVQLAKLLQERGGPILYMDVNQSFQSYTDRLRSSNTEKTVQLIDEIIKEIK